MPYTVEIHQDFPQSLERVFADLSDHESLGRILGAPMTTVVPGTGEGGRSGVGSVRRVGPPLLGFEETVVTFRRNELIEYRVSKGSPIRDHLGRMMFSATPSGCHLHYVITFESKLPFGGGAIRDILQNSASKALAAYARRR